LTSPLPCIRLREIQGQWVAFWHPVFSLKNFFFTWSNETFRALLNYGKIVFLATLFGIVFGSLDKMAIAHYLSLSDLGVYSAYYTASFLVVTQIGALFDNVFFPNGCSL
jgi:O-antigen/teichoic acid export membrane protein